ncbi:MAG TPA: hypothetical protein VHC23_01860 [Jatrophihabitans sp.]|nr:hypothetical protein [Jatrophihabitans sp.]
MLIFGIVVVLATSGLGAAVCWANRDATVHVHLGSLTWSGHLYGVFLAGAVLTGWFFLGAACIQLRLRERRERRAAVASEVAPPRARAKDRRAGALRPAGLHR